MLSTNITINMYKNKNLFTITMESKAKLHSTNFTIDYKKSNLQKNYIKI